MLCGHKLFSFSFYKKKIKNNNNKIFKEFIKIYNLKIFNQNFFNLFIYFFYTYIYIFID